MLQQKTTGTGILSQNQVTLLKQVDRPNGDIFQVSYGCGYEIEFSHHDAGCLRKPLFDDPEKIFHNRIIEIPIHLTLQILLYLLKALKRVETNHHAVHLLSVVMKQLTLEQETIVKADASL